MEYPARRVMPSSPDYEELNAIQTLLCIALNPCCWVFGAPWELDLDAGELCEIVKTLRQAMGEAMQAQAWSEFVKVAEV